VNQFSIRKPDDFHLHLRDLPYMPYVLTHTAAQFQRAMIMPNLKPALTNIEMIADYKDRILKALPEGSSFNPLMTLYLTQNTETTIVKKAKYAGLLAIKLYPSGATTHSDYGVNDIEAMHPFFEEMQKEDMPLSIHCEVTDPQTDIFDREKIFIDRHLYKLHREFPELRIIFEHVTTEYGVSFIKETSDSTAATITPHHLLLNRNDLFNGGLSPHHYCLPIVKTKNDQEALIRAVVSGNSKFFAGTDSAPHPQSAKESAKSSAGIYNAFNSVGFYTEVFEYAGCLTENGIKILEKFLSENGASFYKLPLNTGKIVLTKGEYHIPETLPYHDENLIPLRAGGTSRWKAEISTKE
jgi:dihydroorotase